MARADSLRRFDAVHAVAQPDIHQNQIGFEFGHFLQRFKAVFGNRGHIISETSQAQF